MLTRCVLLSCACLLGALVSCDETESPKNRQEGGSGGDASGTGGEGGQLAEGDPCTSRGRCPEGTFCRNPDGSPTTCDLLETATCTRIDCDSPLNTQRLQWCGCDGTIYEHYCDALAVGLALHSVCGVEDDHFACGETPCRWYEEVCLRFGDDLSCAPLGECAGDTPAARACFQSRLADYCGGPPVGGFVYYLICSE